MSDSGFLGMGKIDLFGRVITDMNLGDLDFAKALDKFDHGRLISKLNALGISGGLSEWIEDWLRGQRQKVKVKSSFSGWEEVLSGVVQGSVPGGVLLKIFIDDIGDAAMDTLYANWQTTQRGRW